MTLRSPRTAPRTLCGARKPKFPTAIVVLASAYLATPTAGFSTPISYILNPPVTAGGIITVTGGFTFDPTGPTLDAVSLAVTGGPQPGSYTVPVSATSSQFLAEIPTTTEMIRIGFANNLGAAPDPASF